MPQRAAIGKQNIDDQADKHCGKGEESVGNKPQGAPAGKEKYPRQKPMPASRPAARSAMEGMWRQESPPRPKKWPCPYRQEAIAGPGQGHRKKPAHGGGGGKPASAVIVQDLFARIGEEELLALQTEILDQLLGLRAYPPVFELFGQRGVNFLHWAGFTVITLYWLRRGRIAFHNYGGDWPCLPGRHT